jgi:hypothetical protein
MARRFQQFFYSFTRQLSGVHGSFDMVAQVKATLVTQGVTMTAAAFGAAGNSITLAFTAGGTAGAEVVTVVGNAISVQIESGVSSITQVVTALQGSAASQALALATGAGAGAVSAAAALPLAGGVDGVSATNIRGVASVTQTAVGEVTIVLDDSWNALMSLEFQVQAATAQDLIPQIKSVNLVTKTIVVNLLTAGTKTDPTSAIKIYMRAMFRASSVVL